MAPRRFHEQDQALLWDPPDLSGWLDKEGEQAGPRGSSHYMWPFLSWQWRLLGYSRGRFACCRLRGARVLRRSQEYSMEEAFFHPQGALPGF